MWSGATACHDVPHPSIDPLPLLRQPARAGGIRTSADRLRILIRGSRRATRITESRLVPLPDPVPLPQGRAHAL